MSSGAWLKWAGQSETPTHTDLCPNCRGEGRREAGSVDDVPFYQRCWRCKGTGEIGAVVMIEARRPGDAIEALRWNPDEPQSIMRLSQIREETIVARTRTIQASITSKMAIKASVLAAVDEQLGVTDEELVIASRVGVTRDELIQQKARDLLTHEEARVELNGNDLTPIDILAARIVR